MMNWRVAIISLSLLVLFSRPVCMQIFWDAANVCNNRSPLCYESDPIRDVWDVELPDCNADRVRVVYTNYSDEYRMVERFEEIRLHCTAPGGTAQADVMPASVNCSGTSTGGNWQELGFVFQNLNATGIQLGWTCAVSGCFELSVIATGATEYVRTPSTDFVLRSASEDCLAPTPTVEPVTTPTTTTVPTTVETTTTLHTTVNTATTGSTVYTGTGNAVTHNDSDTTTISTQSVTTVADMEPNITGTNLLIIGCSTVALALMMLTTITFLVLVMCWKVWISTTRVPATTVHVVGDSSALSNEVCKVELGDESFKVSAISMDKKC